MFFFIIQHFVHVGVFTVDVISNRRFYFSTFYPSQCLLRFMFFPVDFYYFSTSCPSRRLVNKQRDVRTALGLETKTLVGWPALSDFLHSNKVFVNMTKKSGKKSWILLISTFSPWSFPCYQTKYEIHRHHYTYKHTLYSTDLSCPAHCLAFATNIINDKWKRRCS